MRYLNQNGMIHIPELISPIVLQDYMQQNIFIFTK